MLEQWRQQWEPVPLLYPIDILHILLYPSSISFISYFIPGRPAPARGYGRPDSKGLHSRRSGATAPASARGDGCPFAGARGTPSRTLPQARAVNNMHAHNLNAMARFHCSHPAWKDEIITPLPPSLLLPYFFPPSPSLNPVAEPRASRAARLSSRAESYAQSRTCGLMEQCHGSAPRRAAAHYDWRARMWRPRRRLHVDGGHNRALACTWMRHGSLESGCSHACTPRRRTHPNFNSHSLSAFFSCPRSAGVRGEGAGKEGLT